MSNGQHGTIIVVQTQGATLEDARREKKKRKRNKNQRVLLLFSQVLAFN
jgi:hypothetical protein